MRKVGVVQYPIVGTTESTAGEVGAVLRERYGAPVDRPLNLNDFPAETPVTLCAYDTSSAGGTPKPDSYTVIAVIGDTSAVIYTS